MKPLFLIVDDVEGLMMRQFSHKMEKPLDNTAPSKYQLILQPTRTFIQQPIKLDGMPVVGNRATVKNHVLTIALYSGHDFRPADIIFDYVGEPVRPIGYAFLNNGEKEVDSEKEIQAWIECRRSKPGRTPADAFFLDLDLEFFPPLIPYSKVPLADRQNYLSAAQCVAFTLMDRIRSRAVGNTPNPIPCDNHVNALLLVAGRIDKLLDCHFGHDLNKERSACTQFAAGQLRQICKPQDPRIELPHGIAGYSAGDPDSANIFMFAELALAMSELEGLSEMQRQFGRRWSGRVPMFALMQRIYIERWRKSFGQDACFNDYDGSASRLDNFKYDEPCSWLGFIEESIKRTVRGCVPAGSTPCNGLGECAKAPIITESSPSLR